MKKIVFLVMSIFISCAVFSQSADFVTKLISTKKATFGQVCYLAAVYQGFTGEDASETDAMNAMFERGILPFYASVDMPINFEDASGIFSKFWNVKGGLFFKISNGNKRYAFKQFKNDGVISAKTDPSMIPSGVDILNIYTMGDTRYKSFVKKGDE